MTNTTNVYPSRVIIYTEDIITLFINKVQGILHPKDLDEILTQVIAILLNGDGNIAMYNEGFPDYSRLISTSFLNDREKVNILEKAINELLVNIYNRLKRDGVFVNNRLDYYFSKFIYRDIVLDHLPY